MYVYDQFILSPSGGEKLKLLPFFGLRNLVMSTVGGNLRKLNTVHNYKPSPIQRRQNRFCTPMPSWRTTTTTTVLRPSFQDHPGEPVPEENFWTLWCKGRLSEADTPTIWMGTTPSRLTSAHLHHPPWRNRAQNSNVQKCDRQTNKQTDG